MRAVDDAALATCAWGAWAWTLEQVRWGSDGPWIPLAVPGSRPVPPEPPGDRDCLYDGIAGLAPALAEIRLTRAWTEAERSLAEGIVTRLDGSGAAGGFSLYDGLAGSLTAVRLLDHSATGGLLDRLADAATPGGWPSSVFGEPPGPVNDVVLGNAGIVLTCAWLGGELADGLVALGADALVAAAVPTAHGLAWKMYEGDRDRWMPNYSHGTAGVATALAVAGHHLGRADLVEAALLGANHVVHLADLGEDGFRLPLQTPPAEDREPYTYGWCHGPTGTANLFGALRLAGVESVAGRRCEEWNARAARSVRASGLPARLRPGFWDNDGRCCGTAGVLDATLSLAQDTGDPDHLAFADELASALVERAVTDPLDAGARYWRFWEHRVEPPEQDPGVGWMQGTAGIAAALLRCSRVRQQGTSAPRIGLPDDWWMVEGPPSVGEDEVRSKA